jgi:hypothetical protein
MKTLKYALIGALMLPAAGAFAQSADAPVMLAGLTMLETSAANAFRAYGIDAEPTDLSLGQLAEIIAVLNDPAMSSGGESAKRSIETILEADRFN